MTHSRDQTARPALDGAELAAMSDRALTTATEEALEGLTPRARVFALAVAQGTAYTAAAARASLSAAPAPLSRLKRRAEPALRLLREQARRASMLTLEVAVEKFRALSEEARAAKDFSAATRALREAALLLGLYPEVRLRLNVEQTSLRDVSPEEWAALAVLRHQVRRELPAAAAVVDVPAPAEEPLRLPLAGVAPCDRVLTGADPSGVTPRGDNCPPAEPAPAPQERP